VFTRLLGPHCGPSLGKLEEIAGARQGTSRASAGVIAGNIGGRNRGEPSRGITGSIAELPWGARGPGGHTCLDVGRRGVFIYGSFFLKTVPLNERVGSRARLDERVQFLRELSKSCHSEEDHFFTRFQDKHAEKESHKLYKIQ
jgi:hypothetical protein